MRIPRIFLPDLATAAMTAGSSHQLAKGRSHYLTKVLRRQPGDAVEVFDGNGRSAPAELLSASELRLSADASTDPRPILDITLGLALAKGDRMDAALQKATELGVGRVDLLRTERVELKLDSNRLGKRMLHWQAVMASACEQCGRNRVPLLASPVTLETWLDSRSGLPTLLLHPEGANLADLADPGSGLGLLTGPEGGFSPAELALAETAGCQQIRLGPRVMRAETAPLAALAVTQFLWGDLRG